MPLPLLALLFVVDLALVIGSVYRALHPDPTLPRDRQYIGAIFGLIIALAALLFLVMALRTTP